MASIFDSLAYDNSNIPDSVRRAAQGEADYQRAIKNKIPLAVEGSGIPEGVRKAGQAALERGAALNNITNAPYAEPVAPAGNPWMQGQKTLPQGLFSDAAKTVGKYAGMAGRAAGGLGAVYELGNSLDQKYGYQGYQNFKNAAEEGRTRQAMQADPELAQRGQSTVDRIVGGAMTGVNELRPQEAPQVQGGGLTQDELNAPNPNDVPDQAPQQSPMEAPPVEPTPVGPVAQAAPATVPQAAAKTFADQESQRQSLEQGAVKGLSTGAVSRPEIAGEIVKSDAAKSGVTLTPEQFKKATAEELTNMKSMDNNDVGRYVSYALMAAGVLATVFDKSGKAGDAFSASFNKQLDRNLASGLATQKARTEAAKQAQALQIATADRAVRQQQADTQDRSVTQTGEYQQGTLKQRTAADNARLGLGYANIDAANGRAANTNSLAIRRLDQDQSQFELEQAGRNADRTLRRDQYNTDAEYKKALQKQGADRNAIAAAGVAAKGQTSKGIDTTTKDAEGIVGNVIDANGLNINKAAKSSVAQTVRSAAKNGDPAYIRDPNKFIMNVIKSKTSPYEQTGGGFFTDPTIKPRALQ